MPVPPYSGSAPMAAKAASELALVSTNHLQFG
jgi:hypothetical protein